ncbi:MAG: tetratricopeptide repeat protein [Proteobacteria bacterium]|nr:tetratricopeptide repeat protein [Pseudomonadota bacterium]
MRAAATARRRGARALAAAVALALLPACSAVFSDDAATLVDQGFEALKAGDLAKAEDLNQRAIEAAPDNPYALLNLGVVYQRTGRPREAAMLYQRVIELAPETRAARSNVGESEGQPLAEIARRNLAQIGGTVSASREADLAEMGFRALQAGRPFEAGLYSDAALGLDAANPVAMLNRGAAYQNLNDLEAARALFRTLVRRHPEARAGEATDPRQKGEPLTAIAEANLRRIAETEAKGAVAPPPNAAFGRRFAVLRRLVEAGLLSQSEYEARHKANVESLLGRAGAQPPPEAFDAVEARIKELAEGYRAGRIAAPEFAALRAVLLDRLLPAAPLPPLSALEAGSAPRARLLEELVSAGVLTPGEAAGAGQAAMAAAGAPRPAAAPAQPAPARAARPTPPAAPRSMIREPAATAGGGGFGLHLASYRSEGGPEHGWRELKRKNGDLLDPLSFRGVRIDLGPGKGTFYRLVAGPLPARAEADSLCQRLKRRNLFCTVVPF